MAIELYGPFAGLEFNEGLSETNPPFLSGLDPAISGTNVSISGSIALTVDDLDSGVLLSSVIITIDSGSGFANAWSGSAFQGAYSGTLATLSLGYSFTITHSANFLYVQPINVRVQASDVDGNALDQTYSFITAAAEVVTPSIFLKKIYPFFNRDRRVDSFLGIDLQRYTPIYPLIRRSGST